MTDDAGGHLDDARRRLGLSHYDLWVRYIGVGGTRDAHAVRSYLTGRVILTDGDHDHLAVALNEAFVDAGHRQRLRYRHS
jgi:hypothetical protein